MEKGRIGSAITGVVNLFIGRIKGSLAYVTIISSALFGAISGSATATLACIGSVMEPELKRSKYPRGVYASVIANASPLGLLIPPSAAQILYAWAGNQSVLACFLSTVIPGIILTFLSMRVVSFFLLRKTDIIVQQKQTFSDWKKDAAVKSKRSVPALLMPIIILGGIYGGIMTPTESAAVAVLYAIPVGMFIYKGLDWKSLQSTFVQTGTTTGVVMVMFFMVMMFSRILVSENVPAMIISLFTGISSNKTVTLLMINVFMIIIGMLMDDVSGILLCTSLLLPLVIKLGVHPVHFAAILGVNLGMGNITPPTAPLLYFGARVCDADVADMLKANTLHDFVCMVPYFGYNNLCTQLALYSPTISSWREVLKYRGVPESCSEKDGLGCVDNLKSCGQRSTRTDLTLLVLSGENITKVF